MSTVPLSPNTSGPLPRHSTVVLMGGNRVPVDDGLTTRDSLIGVRFDGARYAVPRDSVAFIETRKVSVLRSIGAGAGGLVVATAVLTVMAFAALLSQLE